MNETLRVLWAKKAVENNVPKWLPLPQHLLDTRYVALQLYRKYLSDDQRDVLRHALQDSNSQAENMVQLLASLHDIGKATPAFQMKRSQQPSPELDRTINARLIREGYFMGQDQELPYPQSSRHALAGEAILYRYGIHDDVGAIIGGHHGMTVQDKLKVKDQFRDYGDNYYLHDRTDNIHQSWEEAQNKLVEWCIRINGYPDKSSIPRIHSISAQVILEGMLVMADWIASNTHYFPLFAMEQMQSLDLKQRLRSGWRAWFRDNQWKPRPQKDAETYYQKRFGFSPRPLQKELFQTMQKTTDPGIVIIESGMGSGKTEAALATVEQVAYQAGDRGLFFCLPTQGSTNAMFKRVKKWVMNISKRSHSSNDLQLMHGKAAMNDTFQGLPRTKDVGSDEKDANVLVNEWFSGSKTGVLGNIVVGTIDQFLKLGLKQKHLALRYLGFSKKVVVLDEAHSFDDYMQQYLYRALDWLRQYHIPVIVLSATLPVAKREGMLRAYLDDPDLSLPPQNRDVYPLVTYSHGQHVEQLKDFPRAKDMTIQVHRLASDDLVSTVRSSLKDGGVAGIIVNTVKRAQRLARLFMEYYPADEVTVLHSSFITTHRAAKENKLLNEIGKDGPRYPHSEHRQIIIGTQVIEMSLDIDLDVMFSDLVPMDALLQRLGRLHRHHVNDKKRPKILEQPQLYVMNTSDDLHFGRADTFIYSEYLLMRTQTYLPEQIRLPRDIAPLVQTVYAPQELWSRDRNDTGDMGLSGKLGQRYVKARMRHQDQIKSKQSHAHQHMLAPYDEVEDNLIGWLNDTVDDEAASLAQVRDSNESLEVIVVQRTPDGKGYTFYGGNEDLTEQVSRTSVAKRLAKDTLKLPSQLFQDAGDDPDAHPVLDLIQQLRKLDHRELPGWEDQSYLRNALGIILDTRHQCHLNGFLLTYDKKLGLQYKKEE